MAEQTHYCSFKFVCYSTKLFSISCRLATTLGIRRCSASLSRAFVATVGLLQHILLPSKTAEAHLHKHLRVDSWKERRLGLTPRTRGPRARIHDHGHDFLGLITVQVMARHFLSPRDAHCAGIGRGYQCWLQKKEGYSTDYS